MSLANFGKAPGSPLVGDFETVCEYTFISERPYYGKSLVYAVVVRKRVNESDFCPHGEYQGCDQCEYEYNQMISDQWAEYYAGLF